VCKSRRHRGFEAVSGLLVDQVLGSRTSHKSRKGEQ
jgi:hypothetical protein